MIAENAFALFGIVANIMRQAFTYHETFQYFTAGVDHCVCIAALGVGDEVTGTYGMLYVRRW